MTCSRTEALPVRRFAIHRPALRRLLGGVAGCLLATAAAAQQLPPELPPAPPGVNDEPQSILPPGDTQTPDEQTPDEQAPDEQTGDEQTTGGQVAAPVTPAEPDMSRPPQSVEVGALGKLRLGGTGLLEPGDGGLPETLWAGSTAEAATVRLLAIPDSAPSRALQQLEKRLLLTAAPPPETADDESDLAFVAARLDRLAATGDLDNVRALLGRLGRDFHHDRLNQLAIDVHLLTGGDSDACAIVAANQPATISAEWLRLAAFCRALGGDMDGAALGLEMLAEQKARAPAFDALMAVYLKSGGEPGDKPGPQLKSMKGATPLVLALARLTNAKLAPDVITGAAPLVLAALAQNPDLDALLRLKAADMVAARGGLPLERLIGVYEAAPLKAADLANPLARLAAEPPKSVLAHALAYRAAAAAATENELLAILRAGFARARADGSRMLYASVMAPFLERVTPSAESLPAAGDIIRLQLLAGQIEAAEHWYGVVQRQAALGNAEAAPQAAALWPLFMAWTPGPRDTAPQSGAPVAVWSAAAFDDWVASRAALPADSRARQIALTATLLADAGWPVPAALVPPPVAANPEGGGPGDSLLIVAREGRLGETVLEALKLAGGGLSRLTPATLAALGDGLRLVGLDHDARRIVTETLVIQGL